MPTVRRVVPVTKTTAVRAAPGAARSTPNLSNTGAPAKGGFLGLFIKLIFLAALAAGGYFVWQKYTAFEASRPPPAPPKKQQIQDLPPEPAPPKASPKTNVVKKAQRRRPLTLEEQIALEVAREQVPESNSGRRKYEKPVFDLEEIKRLRAARDAQYRQRFAEAEAARRAVVEKLAAARAAAGAQTLTGFGGVKFGAEVKGVPSAWGPILPGKSVDESGLAYAVYGETVAKPVGTLEAYPRVWVTPQTHRAWQIEFARELKLPKKGLHDPETAQLVEKMKTALKCEPFVLRAPADDVRGAEFAFPVGESTVRIGEFGDQLKLIVTHEGLRREAKTEFDAQRAAQAADTSDDELLLSMRYPMGEAVNYHGAFKSSEGTPRAFCGLVFGRRPHARETIVTPKHGEKGFFVDYVRAKHPIFKGFAVGKADIDFWRGGVFAVTLYNNDGGADGVYDAPFFARVRAAFERQYGVTPEERPGTSEFPELVFRRGDVEVVFGPDRSGGFRVTATHRVLAELAKNPPPAPRARRPARPAASAKGARTPKKAAPRH